MDKDGSDQSPDLTFSDVLKKQLVPRIGNELTIHLRPRFSPGQIENFQCIADKIVLRVWIVSIIKHQACTKNDSANHNDFTSECVFTLHGDGHVAGIAELSSNFDCLRALYSFSFFLLDLLMDFFFGLALLNEIVWRTQSEEFWVNFKVWGLLPITFIFTAFQIGLINKYKINE